MADRGTICLRPGSNIQACIAYPALGRQLNVAVRGLLRDTAGDWRVLRLAQVLVAFPGSPGCTSTTSTTSLLLLGPAAPCMAGALGLTPAAPDATSSDGGNAEVGSPPQLP